MASQLGKSDTTTQAVGSPLDQSLGTPLPVMQIANWPLRDRRLESAVILTIVAVLALFVATVTGSVPAGLVVLAACLISVWRMIVPIRFELDARGVQQICAGRRRFIPWSGFAYYKADAGGVMLLQQHGPLALNALRGVYIHANDRQSELEKLVEFYLPKPDETNETDVSDTQVEGGNGD